MPRIVEKTVRELAGYFKEFFMAGEVAGKRGVLQNVDARIKLVGLVVFIISSLLVESLVFSLFLLLLSFTLAVLSKIPLHFHLRRFILIPFFSFLVAFPQVFLMKGTIFFQVTLWSISLQATWQGLTYLIFFTLQVTTSVSYLSLLFLTTRFSEIMSALGWFRIPAPLLHIVNLTYRYIFVFFSELHRMLLAREARTLKTKGLKETWKELGHLLGNLFIRTLEKGERVYLAALGKGFTGSYASSPIDGKIKKEAAFFLVLIVLSVILVVLSLLYSLVPWKVIYFLLGDECPQ